METKIYNILNAIIPDQVYVQGTYTGDYPERFLTYSTQRSDDNSHYDNKTHSIDWTFYVYIYTKDATDIGELREQVWESLKEHGFLPQGKGRLLPVDEPDYFGWVIEVIGEEILED